MKRSTLAWLALALLVALPAVAQNTQGLPTVARKDPDKEARLRFQGAQAALYSALAHAEALTEMAKEPGELDAEIALAHVKVVARDINECKTDLERMVAAVPRLEKEEQIKPLNGELDAALKATEVGHQAVDGIGRLKEPANATAAHLRKSLALMAKLAKAVGARSLDVPAPEDAAR